MVNDRDEISSACHQLKAISKTIGAEAVAQCSEEFEEKCRNAELDTDELIAQRDTLEIEYSKAAQFLKEQVRSANTDEETL